MGTIDTFAGRARPGSRRQPVRISFLAACTWLVRWLRLSAERRRQRRDLTELTDDQLRDIGLSRGEARREAARPFWN